MLKKKIIIKKKLLFTILSLIIYPFLSLINIYISVRQKNKYYPLLIGLLMAWLSYFLVPFYDDDLVRHWQNYEEIKRNGLIYYFNQTDYFLDGGVYLLMGALVQLKLNRQFLQVFVTFFSYYYILKSFYIIKNEVRYMLFFFTILFYINFKIISVGLRYYLSIAIIIYSITIIFYLNKEKKGYIFLFLGIFMHFSQIFIIPIIFIVKKIKNPKIYRIIFKISLFIYFLKLDSLIINEVINFLPLPKNVYNHLITYTSGEWGAGYSPVFNLNGIIYSLLRNFTTIYFYNVYIFFNIKNISKDTYGKIGILFFVISNCLNFSKTLNSRYGLIGMWFILFYIINSSSKILSYIVFLLSTLYLILELNFYKVPYIYSYREIYKYNFINFVFREVKNEELIKY